MSVEAEEILDRVLGLPPVEKARIVDKLLSSLDQPGADYEFYRRAVFL